VASFTVAAAVVLTLLRPDPLLTARRLSGADVGAAPRPSLRGSLRTVAASPGARLGLTAVASSHAVMVGVMVMTPVHMGHNGAALRVIGLVVSVHVLGMYAFSPVVGVLADRYGRRPVLVLGALLQLAAAAVAGTAGAGSAPLGVGLFLLGLGWSCGLVAGSTLVTESVPAPSRPGVQGAADLVMGAAASVGGLVSGVVVDRLGYPALNVLAAAIVLAMLARLTRRPVPA
jgi:MFS family permease